MHYINHGSVKKVPFMITLNGVPVDVTLTVGDIRVSVDGASPASVNNLPVAVDGTASTGMVGLFEWTPTAAETQGGHYIALYIEDVGGSAFDTNVVIHYTGGNSSARFGG